MKENKFIWADLSSYQPEKIKPFYTNVFGWKFYKENQYAIAYINKQQLVAGVYQTPKKFQEIKMPSFWMSYIQVNDVEQTVASAKKLGAKIELVSSENIIGKVALIRDTLGAGFTVYEGDALNAKTDAEANTLILNELHVSDANKAIAFYTNLFDWSVMQLSEYSYAFYSEKDNSQIAVLHQIDNSIKGTYEYWICVFGVENLTEKISLVEKNNGFIITHEGDRALCSDGSEAFFYLKQL